MVSLSPLELNPHILVEQKKKHHTYSSHKKIYFWHSAIKMNVLKASNNRVHTKYLLQNKRTLPN